MNHPGPFNTAFWIEYEHEPPRSNVVQFPAVARANAAQAAMSVEQDRANMRADIKASLMRQRRELEQSIAGIDAALMELSGG